MWCFTLLYQRNDIYFSPTFSLKYLSKLTKLINMRSTEVKSFLVLYIFLEHLSEIEDIGEKSPFVVLVGNVGVGKSTITEKLTGETGRSSSSRSGNTKTTEYFWVRDKSLLIADSPGSNPNAKQKIDHNFEIAAALNYRNVSKMLVVVKADIKMDQTVAFIKDYVDRFIDFPGDLLGVLVTHMDSNREWEEKDLVKTCKEVLCIKDIVFSQPNIPESVLQKRVLKICNGKPFKFDLDDKSFLRMFKIDVNKKKILKLTNEIVDRFQQYKQCFEDERKKFTREEQANLFFEYKAYMDLQVDKSCMELCEKLGFDFCEKDEAKNFEQAGYVFNMVNQLRAIIFDIRIEALKYYQNNGSSDLRECPYCGCVWAKVEGCRGLTTCGAMSKTEKDINRGIFETATFRFTTYQETSGKKEKEGEFKFHIQRNGRNGIFHKKYC